MTFSRTFLIAALTVPLAAGAQQMRVSVRDDLPPDLELKDIERLSPSRISLERQKELAVTAEQTRRLDSASKAYALHLKDFARSLDTLQNLLDRYHKRVVKQMVDRMTSRPRRDPTTDQERVERARDDSVEQSRADREREIATVARNELNRVLLIIRDDYDAQVAATNAVLNDDQRATIAPIFNAASDELASRLHWARMR
jgi:hypothetical protein